jgi:acylphosphatase
VVSGGPADPVAAPAQARLTAWVEGRVQGVGFRWWVRARALELGLVGCAENLPDGRVKVVAEGAAERCRDLLALLEGGGTPGRVSSVAHRWSPTVGDITSFTER